MNRGHHPTRAGLAPGSLCQPRAQWALSRCVCLVNICFAMNLSKSSPIGQLEAWNLMWVLTKDREDRWTPVLRPRLPGDPSQEASGSRARRTGWRHPASILGTCSPRPEVGTRRAPSQPLQQPQGLRERPEQKPASRGVGLHEQQRRPKPTVNQREEEKLRCSTDPSLFCVLICTGLQLVYSAVLVSGAQQRDAVVHVCFHAFLGDFPT